MKPMPWQPSNSVQVVDKDQLFSQSSSMVDEAWIWTCDLEIPSRATAIHSVHEEVARQLRDQQWPEYDVFGIRLALEEALVNAVKHGNAYDTAKQVRVRCFLSTTVLRVEVQDEGKGFNPAALPDPTTPVSINRPNGRGVMLMRNFMSRVTFNKVGNRVILEKERGKQTTFFPRGTGTSG